MAKSPCRTPQGEASQFATVARPTHMWGFWAAVAPGPLRGWCFSPLVISTHLSHPFPSLLPPVYYTALGFFFFSISWSKSFHELGRKAKKGWTCSGRKPRSNLSFQVSPRKVLPLSDKDAIDGALLSSSLTGSLQCCPGQKTFPTPHANKSC